MGFFIIALSFGKLPRRCVHVSKRKIGNIVIRVQRSQAGKVVFSSFLVSHIAGEVAERRQRRSVRGVQLQRTIEHL